MSEGKVVNNVLHEIAVPRLNSVDDSYLLLEWLVADGTAVESGQPVAVVETSKAAADIEAAADGVLRHRLAAGKECLVGQVLAVIGTAADGEVVGGGGSVAGGAADVRAQTADGGELVVSDRARRLIEQHGITAEQLLATGRSVIREADVLALVDAVGRADEVGSAEVVELSANQSAVRAAVEKSHREIPAAYAGLSVDVDAALAYAQAQSRAVRAMVGITEIVVRALALQRPFFPLMFATLTADGSLRIPPVADVGITMDAGAGLFVPVLRDVAAQPLAGLAAELMRIRRKAMTGRFTADELACPNIVVALNNANSIALAVPIVFPGNVACLSLTAPQRVVELNDSGGVHAVQRIHLGLSYDHRVVNGREAGLFLAALKEAIEEPELLFID
jgi:2-oxoglutarate dehydrogenase E2 component (dihydrolipoamide succinyltransferase)